MGDPPARLDNFSTDSRSLRLFTWNVDTFIGVGKYSRFLEILLTFPEGIYCLQETKSTHSDVLKLSHVHVYLSGTTDDPHAGVGFAIPTSLLPIVYDFHPWNSRIAVLISLTHDLTALHFLLYMLPPQFKIKENINFGNTCAPFSIIIDRTSSQS